MTVSCAVSFAQPAGGGTSAPGYSLLGSLAHAVTVANGNNTNVVNWQFEILDVPPGSAIPQGVVQDGASPTYAFTPDVAGGYHFHVTVRDTFGNIAEDFRVFQTPEASGRIIPPFRATDKSLNFIIPPAVTPNTKGWAPLQDAYMRAQDAGASSTVTVGNLIDSGLTASQAVVTDGTKKLVSLQYSQTMVVSTIVQRGAAGEINGGSLGLDGTADRSITIADAAGITSGKTLTVKGAKGGDSSGGSAAGLGGQIAITAGNGGISGGGIVGGLGGPINITAGDGGGPLGASHGFTGAGGGAVNVKAGNGAFTTVASGDPAGAGGDINFTAGNAGNNTGGANAGVAGNVNLEAGSGSGSSAAGVITLGSTVASAVKVGRAAGKVGLYGANPVVQATRAGQVTDNTGGAASTTFAAITAGVGYTQADMLAVKNALASMAAQYNKVDTIIHNLGAST